MAISLGVYPIFRRTHIVIYQKMDGKHGEIRLKSRNLSIARLDCFMVRIGGCP